MSWRAIMGVAPAPKHDPQNSHNPQKSRQEGISADNANIADGASTTTGVASPAPEGAGDHWSDWGTVADTSHPPSSPESEPADWGAWFRTETARRAPTLGADAAERRVWGIALNLWHRRHGKRPDAGCCAGCGRPVRQGFRLPDGAAIHDDARFADCLIRYGQRWRGRAAAGLLALGLREPDEGGDR